MGLLDRVKSAGSSVIDAAKSAGNAVSEKVESAKETVTQTAEAVKDGFSEAKKVAVEISNQVGDVSTSVIPSAAKGIAQHDWYGTLNHAADRLGDGLSTAGSKLEDGGRALAPFLPSAAQVVALGQGAQVLGKSIADAPETAVATGGALLEGAQALQKKAEAFVADAEKKIDRGIEAAKSGVESLKKSVTDYVGEVSKAVDYHHNIDSLGPNDKYKIGVGAQVSVEGGKGYTKGSIEVSKNAQGKYVVAADGEIGGGIYGEIGGKLGAKLNAEGSATLGAGGKIEMTFDSAEDAKKAADIMMKQAAASAISAGTAANPSILPGVGQLGSLVASQSLQPSADELKFLADHTSALELRGNVAAEVGATVGLKNTAGIFGGAKVKDEVAVRVELKDENNKVKSPPELVVKQTVTGEVNAGAGFNTTDGAKKATGGKAAYLNGKGEAKVEVEQRFSLPTGVSTTDLMRDPAGTVKKEAAKMAKSEKDKVTLGLDLQGNAFGNGGGLSIEASYGGDFNSLKKSTFESLQNGDMAGALKGLDSQTASVKIEPYTTIGFQYSPGLSVMGFGGQLDLEASRKDVSDANRFEVTGTPSQVAEALDKQYGKYIQPPVVRPVRVPLYA